MTLIVDASVAIRWLFDVDRSNNAEQLLRSGHRIIAPDLIAAEIANAAWKFVSFGRLQSGVAADILMHSLKHFDELVSSADLMDRAFAIAVQLQHPAYDCFYLALAEQRESSFVTADERLLRRCGSSPFAELVRSLGA
jgi:predicted nucleic acid-binding protein